MTDATTLRRATAGGPTPGAPSRGVQLAWLIPGGILAIAALVWGTFNVISLLAHEQYTTTTTFDAADVSALEVSNENGSVTVDSIDPSSDADPDVVVVTADVNDGWTRTDVSTQVVDG
ncbi:MAG: hypothetical protein WBP59_08820, partial [Ilumatobacteraceae bacterium]